MSIYIYGMKTIKFSLEQLLRKQQFAIIVLVRALPNHQFTELNKRRQIK